MAGCFGNSDYDKHLEHQVNEYCSIPDYACEECDWSGFEKDLIFEDGYFLCPVCHNKLAVIDIEI